MDEGKLSFSTFELYIDKVHFGKRHIDAFLNSMPYSNTVDIGNTKCQKINIKYDGNTNRFILMSVHEGKFFPLSPTVFNKSTRAELPNQRTSDEAEWSQQYYAIYDFELTIFYISNITKKGVFEKIIAENIFDGKDVNILISNIYKNPEEFISTISKPKRISFARKKAKQNSLLDNNDLFDPKWADGSESFSVELSYKDKGNFVNKMREFLKLNNKKDISRLICVGLDDKNFEKIYRVDSLIEKIYIDIEKNEYGLYDDSIVFEKFVRQAF